MNNLPRWVWDLVIDLEDQEMEHPKLFQRQYAKTADQADTYVESEWCPGKSLNMVPADVKEKARAIRDYIRQVEKDKQPSEGEGH